MISTQPHTSQENHTVLKYCFRSASHSEQWPRYRPRCCVTLLLPFERTTLLQFPITGVQQDAGVGHGAAGRSAPVLSRKETGAVRVRRFRPEPRWPTPSAAEPNFSTVNLNRKSLHKYCLTFSPVPPVISAPCLKSLGRRLADGLGVDGLRGPDA